MSTTPLFDAIARRRETLMPGALASQSSARGLPAPTSPMSAPVPSGVSTLVPVDLVAAIDEIPNRIASALPTGHAVGATELGLVEAVADAITRAVVDAVVAEIDRIAADGFVRA